MGWTKRWQKRLRALARKDAVERELDEELALHLELETEKNLRAGMTPEEARRQAALAFGGVEKHKEEVRDARVLGWMPGMSLDFKLGFRMLVKYPGLTLVGGLAMAFAIWVGASTFEILSQVISPSLPLEDGDRIVAIENWDEAAGRTMQPALHDFAAWREDLASVRELGAFRTMERNLITSDGRGDPVTVAEISASAFQLARVPPLLGRPLIEADELPSASPVIVVGHSVWQSRFRGDPDVVGRTVQLDREQATVVGVMPADFAFPINHNLWVPLRLNVLNHERGQGPAVGVFGRLAPGATLGDAQAELTAVGQRAAATFPNTHEHLRPRVLRFAKSVVRVSGLASAGMMSINLLFVMLVVLICGNVGLLMFARAATRESEIVVRTALGASRGRISGQLFAEAMVLAGFSAIVGLAAAAIGLPWGFSAIQTQLEGELLPFWFHASLSPATILYAGALTVLASAISGVLPALKVTGHAVGARLRQGAVGGTSLRFGKLWTGVLVTQVALTVFFVPIIIEVGMDRNEIRNNTFGITASEYLSVRLRVDQGPSPNPRPIESDAEFQARSRAMYEELKRRLLAQPGVVGVTFANHLPGSAHGRRPIEVEGLMARPDSSVEIGVQTASVDEDFFEVFEAPILAGRTFQAAEIESSADVVIVNQEFVREVLGGRNAVGRRIRYLDLPDAEPDGEEPERWHTIIGVVRQLGMSVNPDLDSAVGMYHPAAPRTAEMAPMAVHVKGDPQSFIAQIRTLATAVDPTLRLYDLGPLDEARQQVMWYTFWLRLGTLTGCIALFLSTTAIYAIMSFTVARRTREIGIRLALGADRRRIIGGIFSRAFMQVGLGIAVGAALILSFAGGIHSVKAASVFAAYVVVMGGVCMLACIVPTRRALGIEPTEAMRADG